MVEHLGLGESRFGYLDVVHNQTQAPKRERSNNRHYYYNRKVTKMVVCHEAIKTVMVEAGRILSARAVISHIYEEYPDKPWKESTIYTHLYGCSVNNPPAYTQHPSFPKFLFDHGRRHYELYDQQKHGKWSRGYKIGEQVPEDTGSEEIPTDAAISLERDLEEYIIRDLSQIESGLELYSEEDITGRQFSTEVGRIDLLAIDKDGNFVVIELKAGTANYSAIGQILGYISWIRQNVAKGKEVRGIIIADDFDRKLRYASSEISSISLKKYVVSFTFTDIQNGTD